MLLRVSTIVCAVLVAISCGDGEDDDDPSGTTEPFVDVDPVQCVPGTTSMCYCGFLVGEQTCLPSGYEKGPCRCDDDDPSSGASSDETGEPTTGGSSSG